MALLTLRAGLVGVLTLYFCLGLWMNLPVTANPNAPHFGIGLAGVLMIVAVGPYGALTSSRVFSSRHRLEAAGSGG